MKLSEMQTFHVYKGSSEKESFRTELQIIFVVEGELEVGLQGQHYEVKREDIILINSGVPYSIKCGEGAIYCLAAFAPELLAEVQDSANIIFQCNSTVDREHSYRELREIFHGLMYEYAYHSHSTQYYNQSLLLRLLDHIIEHCILDASAPNEGRADEDVRVQQMIRYVNVNYRESVSLQALAGEMFVSASTLSRLFKKKTGIYFADYVNQVKARSAVQRLLYSRDSLTQIALDCGFSTPSAFNRVFHEVYGLAPSEYRKGMQEAMEQEREKEQKLRDQLRRELQTKQALTDGTASGDVYRAAFPVSEGRTVEKGWNNILNIGSLYMLSLANVQYHVALLKEQLGFTYGRVWNVYSDRMLITEGKRVGHYNYDMLDFALEYLVKSGLIPYIDCGRKPRTLVTTEGKVMHYDEECIEFQSREIWEAAVSDLVAHVVERFGETEVSKWIFEASYDRIHGDKAIYYRGQKRYEDVFVFLYKTVKRLAPGARVVGPLLIPNLGSSFMNDFLDYAKEQQCIPDGISLMLFPYDNVVKGDHITYHRTHSHNFEEDVIKELQKLLDEKGLSNCGIIIAEWNPTLSNRNYLNDSCFRGAYFADKLNRLAGKFEMSGIWMGMDWISTHYDTVNFTNGGSGLITRNSICKPIFFVMQFMNTLGTSWVSQGENYFATRREADDYYILCFNPKRYGANYYLEEENMKSPEKLEGIFDDLSPLRIRLDMQGLPDKKKYIIKKRFINEKEGTILSEWKKFQYDSDLTSQDVKYIRNACYPRMSMERKETEKGTLHIETELQPHEVALFHIYESSGM